MAWSVFSLPHQPNQMALFGPSRQTKNSMNDMSRAIGQAESQANTASQAGMDFYNSFASRNRGLLGIQNQLNKQVKGYMSGKDVSSVFKGQKALLDAVAQQNRGIMEMTGGMGTNAFAKSDPRYMRKLQNVAGRKMRAEQGRQMVQGAIQQNDANISTLGNIRSALTQDQLSGLTALNQGFSNMANVAGLYGNKFNASMSQDAATRAGIMGMINLGIGGITGIGGLMKK